MPLKLIAPDQKRRQPNFRVRGTYLGVYLDRTTESPDRRTAEKLMRGWKTQIETGQIRGRGELTFNDAAISYLQAGGDDRFLGKITDHLGMKLLAREVDQALVDRTANELYPDGSPATRNRQVYTPIVAVLSHSQVAVRIKRPKGALGQTRHIWLEVDEFDKVHAEAMRHNQEIALLMLVIFYTGLRLGEALAIDRRGIDFKRETAFVGKTKNGQPRPVYLPPVLIAALSRSLAEAADGPLFPTLPQLRRAGGSRFYEPVYAIYKAAGVDPKGAPFHVGRHSFGRNMTRAGADLVATKVWRSRAAAGVYEHFDHNEESRKAALIPGADGKTSAQSVRKVKKAR